MRNRRHRRKKILLALIPLFVSCILLALPLWLSNRIKFTLSSPLKPMQKAFLVAGKEVKRAFLWIPNSWKASERVELLEEELLSMENKLTSQEAAIQRLRGELASLTEYYEGVVYAQKPLLAHVVGYDTSDFRKSITIDIGKRHGITPDSVVLADNALVGRVSSVGASTSRVLLITDPGSRVPARILETSELGVVEGGTGNLCRLKYLSRWGSRVEKGYRVVSSPMGGIYPDSLFIATVAEDLEEDGVPYRTLKLRPSVDMAGVDTVLVLKK